MMSEGQSFGGFTRRSFIENLSRVGGIGLVMAGMDAFGVGIASAQDTPPPLSGSAAGKKVVILGAGLAGLTAAYELQKAGYRVEVLEAREYAGGRCQTARSGFSLTELGGERQDCRYDKGQYFNHGPWRIPHHHHSLLYYTRLLGVPLEVFVNDNEAAYVYAEKGAGPLAGKTIRRAQIAADIRGYAAEMLAKVVNQGTLDAEFSKDDREAFIAYLVGEGYLSRSDLRYLGTTDRGYATPPGAGLQPGQAAPPYAFKDVLHSKMWRNLSSVTTYSHQGTMFQAVGGMDQIAKGFEKQVGRLIRYNAVVDKIAQNESGVEIFYTDKAGKKVSAKGDFCLCTIPLSVLRTIDLAVSPRFKQAMTGVSYMPVGKIGLQMKNRFWENNHSIYGGVIETDITDVGSLAVPSTGYQSQKGVMLGYYQFNASAAKISAKTPAERAAFAVEMGSRVFPEYRDAYETHFSVAWHRVQYNLGGWAAWSADGRKNDYPVLLEPDGRIYLAGEHLSYLGAWQAGAIESAWQQIAKIHARAQAA
jgi:monoamine oxidase